MKTKPTINQYLRKLLQYFLQGLLILAPVTITILVVLKVFSFVDGILPNLISYIIANENAKSFINNIPGLGFIVVVGLIIFMGRISSSFFVKRFINLIDALLENTPGIKFIYSSIKDFIEAFAGSKKKFDKPVLVCIENMEVWRVGFITQTDALLFDKADSVVVYMPHSYAISGITYVVPKNRIQLLNNVSAADAMKFVVSGGVTDLHQQESHQ